MDSNQIQEKLSREIEKIAKFRQQQLAFMMVINQEVQRHTGRKKFSIFKLWRNQ